MATLLLTTKPKKRQISIDHPEWLYVYPGVSNNDLYLRALITYQDGTLAYEDIVALGNHVSYRVKIINIGYPARQYQFIDPTKTIKSIELFINESEVDTIDASIILIPVKITSDNVRALYYHNSLGGLDSFICTGDKNQAIRLFKDLSNVALPLGYDITKGAAQIQPIEQQLTRSVKVYSGNKPKGEIEALDDLFLIKKAYELKIVNGSEELFSIIPTTEQLKHPEDRSNLQNSNFEYEYAFNDKAIDPLV